jgi:hypothetical protein
MAAVAPVPSASHTPLPVVQTLPALRSSLRRLTERLTPPGTPGRTLVNPLSAMSNCPPPTRTRTRPTVVSVQCGWVEDSSPSGGPGGLRSRRNTSRSPRRQSVGAPPAPATARAARSKGELVYGSTPDASSTRQRPCLSASSNRRTLSCGAAGLVPIGDAARKRTPPQPSATDAARRKPTSSRRYHGGSATTTVAVPMPKLCPASVRSAWTTLSKA